MSIRNMDEQTGTLSYRCWCQAVGVTRRIKGSESGSLPQTRAASEGE